MYVSPAELIYSAAFAELKPSKAEIAIYQTLAADLMGTFDPMAAASATSTLLDLSTSEPSGLTMFDVLAASYGVGSSSTEHLLLSAYPTES
jgi:hypothetical protein